MKEKVYTNEILIEGLFYMRLMHSRKSITANELSLYQNHIIEESEKQGIEIEIMHDSTERLTRLRELVDTIFVNGETVYRINPGTSTEDLDDLAHYYRSLHTIVVPGMNAPMFMSKLNDFDCKSEAACQEFQRVDERHQLDIMYQLYSLEKQKRQLEQTLGVVRTNSVVQVDDIAAETILEANADISKSDFISQMVR